jgi:hypothetical protein
MKELLEAELNHYELEYQQQAPGRQKRLGGEIWDHRRREPFARHLWPEAQPLLLSYIGDERFELDAAIALRRFAPFPTSDIEETGAWKHGPPTFKLRRERRRAYLDRTPSPICHPVAARVLDRIRELAPHDDESWARARNLAASAAWMDSGPRINEIIELIERDPAPRRIAPVLEALALTGYPIRADWILPGLAEAEAEYFSKDWRPDDDFYILKPWLDMLAQSDRPLELVDRMKEYPRDIRRWRVQDFIPILMLADPDAMIDAIEALHAVGEHGDGDHVRVEALFRVGSDRALTILLDDVLAGRYQGSLHFGFRSPNAIAGLLEREPSRLQAIVLHLSRDAEHVPKLRRLASLCAGVETDVLFNLSVGEATGPQALLWRTLASHMLEAQCVLQESTGHGSYALHQKSVAHLRKTLFDRMRASPGDDFWREQLRRVDRIVSNYGGHPEDPRHPDLASGVAYPEVAEDFWDRYRSLAD